MLFPNLSLFLEAVGAVLLIVMIVYAVRLNRRLTTLQSDKEEFERLLSSFTESTDRAEASVIRLRTSATETATSLQTNVTKAQTLHDDLTFMIDRAEELANRLESAIGAARSRRVAGSSQGAAAVESVEDAAAEAGDDSENKSKSDLLKALEGMR